MRALYNAFVVRTKVYTQHVHSVKIEIDMTQKIYSDVYIKVLASSSR